jgi:predicted RNA binding protein YcfA (HicA-like mRNA interferase family)
LLKIRDVLRRLEGDGWFVARTTGIHGILKHPTKKGIVVVAGHPSNDVASGTLNSVWKQAELEGNG